jgi:DNA (cytosine-5)-methyltransferase 1
MKLDFFNWLIANKRFCHASAKDTVSRLKRVGTFCKPNWNAGAAVNLTALGNAEEFGNLTVSVRSQLRRAISLYSEFLQDSKAANKNVSRRKSVPK